MSASFLRALSMAVSALRFRGLWEDEMFARQHSRQLYVHTRRVRVTFRFTDRCYAVAWSRANQTDAGLERPCLCEGCQKSKRVDTVHSTAAHASAPSGARFHRGFHEN